MVHVPALRRFFGAEHSMDMTEGLRVCPSVRAPCFGPCREMLELDAQDRSLEAIHPTIPADYRVIVFLCLAVIAEHSHLVFQFKIVGNACPRLAASPQVFARIQAKTSCMPNRSSGAPFVPVSYTHLRAHE